MLQKPSRIGRGFFIVFVSRLALIALCCGRLETVSSATLVRLESNLGTYEVELLEDNAPATVANFITYVDGGKFDYSIVHRSVGNFVIQSGGFTLKSNSLVPVPTDPPVVNEPGVSNLRGTVAMAKSPGDPNSATSQWFVNLTDNSANLDVQNEGFTVFGRVAGLGMAVVDAMSAVPVYDVSTNLANPAFSQLPLLRPELQVQNLLVFERVSRLPEGTAAVDYDFAASDHSFTAGFADLPEDYNQGQYELTSGHLSRPEELGGAKALYISGSNASGDLFMFWKKKVTGLSPNTDYEVAVDVEFASRETEGAVGVGSAPGGDVTIKVGASTLEPLVVAGNNGTLAVNIDKGNQSQGGGDMAAVGNVAKPSGSNEDYAILYRNNRPVGQIARTAADGSLWLIVGTDSGYEGATSLYYTKLAAVFVPIPTPAKEQRARFKLPKRMVFGGEYILRAKFSAKGPVTYSVDDPEAAEVTGNRLAILKAETPFRVTASQAGDNVWKAAEVHADGTAAKRPQKIAFTLKARKRVGEEFNLLATINSDLPIEFTSSDQTIVRVDGDGTATALAKGKAVLTAEQPGDDNHLAAKPVMKKVVVK